MDKGEVIQLNAALSIFEDHLDEIKQACEENIQHIIISTTRSLNQTQKYWAEVVARETDEEYEVIEKELHQMRLRELITPIQKVHRRIVGRQQHVLNPKIGRITETMIERAKEHPLEELYEGRLFGRNKNKLGLCPFHTERTPSFTIFPNNRYHCFGCGEHGSVIDFVMKTENKTFLEAVRLLQ